MSFKFYNRHRIIIRIIFFVFIGVVIYLNTKRNREWLEFIHLFYPVLLLTYFYGETSILNNLIFTESLDPLFIRWDEVLFGFQPSIEFSVRYPQKWISEILHFGYFSYYILTFGVCFIFYLRRKVKAEKIIFLVISSFFIYYLIFIIFPVVGPQFFFESPLSKVADTGFFSRAVKLIQYYGEHPTGAFPSSHVGMALIFLYVSFGNIRWLFWVIFPLFLLILLATVYIKAHYAIDVIAGLVSAPIVYFFSVGLYNFLLSTRK